MSFCKILCIVTVAVVFLAQGTYATYIREDFLKMFEDEEAVPNIGIPSIHTETDKEETAGCKKDILIILDTSRSIGKENFDKEVKPFLRDFISDKNLDVGPNGAQVSLLLFSKFSDSKSTNYNKNDDKTKLVIPFDLHYDAKMFERYINITEWADIEGGHTRTDKALEIANNVVFPKKNPANNRPNLNDVIILITDGRPTGTQTVEDDTLAYAKKLKEKGILIIGVGVGSNIKDEKFWGILKKIATPGQAMRVKFDKFQSIRDTLVNSSCRHDNPFSPGLSCHCSEIQSSTIYLKPGVTSVNISWQRPEIVCPGISKSESPQIRDFSFEPHVLSPATFGNGKHNIEYTFFLVGKQKIKCAVKFDVRACECPQTDPEILPVKPGDTKVKHEWSIPVPSCLDCPSPLTSQSLSVGQHSMTYVYNIADQFNMTCKMDIKVKGALCKGNGYDPKVQDCCCGAIHDKRPGYECCGPNYYDIKTQQCCPGDNIRKIHDECMEF